MTDWITASVAPPSPPMTAHENPEGYSPGRHQVVLWLVQHKFADGHAVPVDSRVVPAFWDDGKVQVAVGMTVSVDTALGE